MTDPKQQAELERLALGLMRYAQLTPAAAVERAMSILKRRELVRLEPRAGAIK